MDTLNYPGAVSMGHMAKFLRSIEWWKLEPHPELVSEYPAKYCSGIPGNEYVVLARWGGTLKLDLRPSSETDMFKVTWTDLTNQKERDGGTMAGGRIRQFRAPEGYPSGYPRCPTSRTGSCT